MTARRILFMGGVAIVVAVIVMDAVVSRTREGRRTTRDLRADITALRAQRDRLQSYVLRAMSQDPRLNGLPDRELRVGMPTTLASSMIAAVVTGLPEHVTLQLEGLQVRRQGDVRRVVTLGEYDLSVTVMRVAARLTTGVPDIEFGGNRLSLALPVRIASGTGSAAIDFRWSGSAVGGAVCGDLPLKEIVTGTVRPATYRLSGTLHLSRTDDAILLTPRFPPLRIVVRVTPSKASWDLVQKTLDAAGGLCGFVLDRVDIRGALEEFLATGFTVRLPTERFQSFALPAGIASTLTIRGTPIQFASTDGSLTITDDMIWAGANVTLASVEPQR